jgi:2-aminoadipate transaminase
MDWKFSEALSSMHGTATREIYSVLHRPGMISLAGGSPAIDCIPVKQLEAIAAEVFSDPALVSEGYKYATTEGLPELREAVISLAGEFGIDVKSIDKSQAIITSGGGQALDLILKTFINRGDAVLVENPTYLGFLQTAQSYGSNLIGVEGNDHGLDLDDLEKKMRTYKPKIIYVVPTFSNPTGKTYSAENRKALIDLAIKYNVLIIEDDPYSNLRFSGEPVPPIKSFDKNNEIVVYVSSFSKVIAPGIRLGFSIGPSDVIRKMTIAKQGVDLCSSNISQLLVLKYLEKGYYFPNIKKSLPVYRKRKEAMFDSIKKYMPEEYSHTDPDGGLFIWGRFSVPINTVEMLTEAIGRNIAYITGSSFYADGSGLDTLRLNFSNENSENIDKAVKILGDLSKEKISSLKVWEKV